MTTHNEAGDDAGKRNPESGAAEKKGEDCPNCKGTGAVDAPFSGSDPVCPYCDGEGVVKQSRVKRSGTLTAENSFWTMRLTKKGAAFEHPYLNSFWVQFLNTATGEIECNMILEGLNRRSPIPTPNAVTPLGTTEAGELEAIVSDILFKIEFWKMAKSLEDADRMALKVDEQVKANQLGSRSEIADARLNYGQPFSYIWLNSISVKEIESKVLTALHRVASAKPATVAAPKPAESPALEVFPDGWSFHDALDVVRDGFFRWKDKRHNAGWVRKIDGTPIENDLSVNMAEAFLQALAKRAAARKEAAQRTTSVGMDGGVVRALAKSIYDRAVGFVDPVYFPSGAEGLRILIEEELERHLSQGGEAGRYKSDE